MTMKTKNPAPSISYFQQRLQSVGLSDETNTLPDSIWDIKKNGPVQLFEEDPSGNIIINYFTPQGGKIQWKKNPSNKWSESFQRIRFHPDNEYIDKAGQLQKYKSPAGSGMFPYFPPEMILKYQAKEKIKRLVITEGEFKAVAGCRHGLDVIGIPSIHGFYGEKNEQSRFKVLHDDLVDFIKVCQVETLIYLTDADTMVVKYERGKEMTGRPVSFMTAVRNFRQATGFVLNDKSTSLEDIYFAHIQTEHVRDAKGLDDLLEKFREDPEKIQEIKDELARIPKLSEKSGSQSVYFQGYRILNDYERKLKNWFGLTGVNTFWQKYSKYIGKRNPFIFKGAVYEHNGDDLKMTWHTDIENFMRVGSTWYKKFKIPTRSGQEEERIITFKVDEIKRDYETKYPSFLSSVRKYDAFCNIPDWSKDYRRDHLTSFNLAHPLPWTPQKGEWPTIYKFLKHIFGGEGSIENGVEQAVESDIFTVAMDWLTIFHRFPMQKLPVLLLVSPENNTGKSTFLELLQSMYGSNNVVILNNEQFKMRFNSHYISKMIIGIDEGFLDIDKKQEKERLKQLVTSSKQFIEFKGVNLEEFDYYGKVVMSSNDASTIMKMDDGEDRWFVVRVHQIAKEDKDPLLLDKMKQEIPAFLKFLEIRQIYHPQKDRLWFEPRHFITEQFRIIVQETKSFLQKLIEEWVNDQFLTFRTPVLKYDLAYLSEQLSKWSKYKVVPGDVKKILKEKYSMSLSSKTEWLKIPSFIREDGTFQTVDKSARYLEFNIEDWCSPEDIDQIRKESDGQVEKRQESFF